MRKQQAEEGTTCLILVDKKSTMFNKETKLSYSNNSFYPTTKSNPNLKLMYLKHNSFWAAMQYATSFCALYYITTIKPHIAIPLIMNLQTQINIAISDMWLDLNQKNAKTPIPTYTIHMHINPDLSRFHQLTHGVKKEKPKSNQT